MDERDRQIEVFAKKYALVLSSKEYDKGQLKESRKLFFIDILKYKFGNPTEQEIAFGFVRYLVRVGRLKNLEETRTFIESVPFLKNEIRNTRELENLFKTVHENSILTIEDLSKLNQAEYLQKKSEEIKSRIIEQKTEEIEKAIAEKKKEFSLLPSILDQQDFAESSEDTSAIEKGNEWWQILGLQADPFPRQEGLDKIPKELYDSVIYKSELIEDYVTKVYSNREKILNKGVLVLGGYGTGKTTFFDYLTIHFLQNKIYPIRIVLPIRADIISYRADFITALFINLKNEYQKILNAPFYGEPSIENCKSIMLTLKKEKWSFIVILDDLHKHKGYEDVVLDFLSTLQIDKDIFIRAGIDIGFLVSGLPSWEDRLKKDGSLLGFFDAAPERIGKVSSNAACMVINNRLKAYSIGDKRKNLIDLAWIDKVHRKLENDNNTINYRVIIDAVVDKLRNKNFDILESNHLSIASEKVEEIRALLFKDNLMGNLKDLLAGGRIKYRHNKVELLRAVFLLYNRQGLTEQDPEFIPLRVQFKYLLELNIITKERINKDKFKWVLAPRVKSIFDGIKENYALYPEDYIMQLFNLETPFTTGEVKASEFLTEFNEFKEKVSVSMKNDVVNTLLGQTSKLLENYKSLLSGPIDSGTYQEKIDSLISCLTAFSRAIFLIHGNKNMPAGEKQLLEFWNDYWYSPNAISPFVNEVYYTSSAPSREKIGKLLLYFKEAFEEILQREKEALSQVHFIQVPYLQLKRTEAVALDDLRRKYNYARDHADFFEIVKDLNILLELKLRAAFFHQLNLIYGDIKKRLQLYGNIEQEFRKKGIDYGDTAFNEFQNINRGEYKSLVNQNKKLREQYFNYLFSSIPRTDLESFLDIFSETNKIVSHLKEQKITTAEQGYIYRFLLLAIDVLKSVNNVYLELIFNNFYFLINEANRTITVWFSLSGLKEEEKSYRIEDENLIKNIADIEKIVFSLDDVTSVYQKIVKFAGDDGSYIVDLENWHSIFATFSIDYRKFCAIIALLRETTMAKKDAKFPLTIQPYFGSEIKLVVYKTE